MKKTLLSLSALGIASVVSAATITVTSSADAGAGTLRQAIIDANAGDDIVLNVTDTIQLSSELTIDKNLTLSKMGKGEDVIDGQNSVRIINISGTHDVSISDITFYDGKALSGGNIYSNGNLTLTNCVIKSGYVDIKGGGVYLARGTNVVTGCTFEGNQIWNNQNLNTYIPYGGGLYNGTNGVTTIENCTFDGNSCRSASWTIGGGAANEGTMIINNSTFVNNTLESTNSNYACIGAGVGNLNKSLTMSHCTVVNNNIINGFNRGAGVAGWQAATMNISNCILYGNTMQSSTASDINIGQGAAKTSQGYNLIGAVLADFNTVSTDILGQDPLLGSYGLNGGTTNNYAIGCNSPAYQAANPASAGTTSQNGVTRTDKADIGSHAFNGALPSITTSAQNTSCFGASDGAGEVTNVHIGYTYAWSNGQSGANLTGVTAGSYVVTATDGNQCANTDTVVVGQPSQLEINLDAYHESCVGAKNGSVQVNNPNATYEYAWSTGDTGTVISFVGGGTYTVTATDNSGCSDSASATVNAATPIDTTVLSTPTTCHNGSNGTAYHESVNANYKYLWSTGDTTSSISNLSAGSYQLTITHRTFGCKDSATITVGSPDSIAITGIVTDASNGDNGAVDITVAGGTPGYTYSWTHASATTEDITGVSPGTYTVTVTDTNSCVKTKDFTVGMVTGTHDVIANGLSAFPNPSTGDFTVASNGNGLLTIYSEQGQAVLTQTVNAGQNITISNLSAGIYIISLQQAEGISVLKQIIR